MALTRARVALTNAGGSGAKSTADGSKGAEKPAEKSTKAAEG